MDTKSKNIKYKLGTKIIAVVILWLSAIVSFGSGAFLAFNTEQLRTNSYEETYSYQGEVNRLIHNTVEFGTRFKHGANKGLDPSRYRRIQNNLSNAMNFNYYIKDLERGKTSYKISGDYTQQTLKDAPGAMEIRMEDGALFVGRNDHTSFSIYEYNDIEKMLTQTPQEIVVLMNNPPLPGDMFYDMFESYNLVKGYMPLALGALLVSIIFMLISLGYLVLVSGRKERGGQVFLADIDRIYNDLQSLFLLVAAGVSISLVVSISFSAGRYSPEIIIIILIFAVAAAIGMTYLFSMIRQFKKGVLLKNTLIWKVISKGINTIKMIFDEKIFNSWILGLILVYGLINGLLFRFLMYPYGRLNFIGLIITGAFNVGAIYWASKGLKSITIIMGAAKEISNGNLEYDLDPSEISMEFQGFAADIQSIQGGLKNAVNEAIKGERMKTDLITNVSHDLKTPLTSIINYVDLLKQEVLNNQQAEGYIQILEEKSYRLKQLIEDLIEASKASSGNIVITKEAVDLHELLVQACGEYEEKIKESQLDLRINAPEDKVLVLADGKYMWRIIENIMSNALKYSMAGSRLYIDIEEKDGYGRLTMKNISAYPLDIDPSQLTQRFIRGEESRTTEGSGLGLSIAQSLTSIQDGRFYIEIDGDLFKVIVEMALE